MSFDKYNVKTLSDAIMAELRLFFIKTDTKLKYPEVTMTQKRGTYSPTEFTMKIVFNTNDVDGNNTGEADYKLYGKLYGLPEEMLGKTFPFGSKGKIFTVTGFLPNRPKRNIQITDTNGKEFIAPHTQVIRAYELHTAKSQLNGNSIPGQGFDHKLEEVI